MSLRRFFVRSFALSALAVVAVAAQGCAAEAQDDDTQGGAAAQSAARPPQFVLLAFDGSYNNDFWNESREFAKAEGVKFTYFINPVYYVARPNNMSCVNGQAYKAPDQGAGKSAIGWGDDSNDIKRRLEQTALAHAEGHEIASHAVGHWNGSAWSESGWDGEFAAFNTMFFNAARIAGIPAVNLGFDKDDIVGFRAPQLGHSPGLFRTLAKNNFTYDTSKSDAANYWPKKDANGIWNQALARLKIAGSGKNTLSMDYNFYVADSKGVNDPNSANHATYERQMVDTYMAYFQSNYYGNRAPVHIGHHFSKWNGGAYWKAMKTFTQRVCGLPETKCVTYKEFTAYLNQNAGRINDFQAGNFPKAVRPPSADFDESVVSGDVNEADLVHDEAGAHDDAPVQAD